MAIFRSSSKAQKQQGYQSHHVEQKMGAGDSSFRTLDAVKEAQPFEEATTFNRRTSYLSQESDGKFDIYGNRINVPDMLNPLRHRDERPLDTIRGFEYLKNADPLLREIMAPPPQLETHLGWGFHEDFPHQNYNGGSPVTEAPRRNYGQGQPSYGMSSNTYQAPSQEGSSGDSKKKKKKKGLFGRSK